MRNNEMKNQYVLNENIMVAFAPQNKLISLASGWPIVN
jgi:hypothetical protein